MFFDVLGLIVSIISIGGLLVIIDTYFIGVIPLLFLKHRSLRSLRESITYSTYVHELKTDCFKENQNDVLITSFTKEFDSMIAITEHSLLIGKRLLSYHYKISLECVDNIDIVFQKKFLSMIGLYKINVRAKKNDRACNIYIKRYVFHRRSRQDFEKIISVFQKSGRAPVAR